MFYPERKDHTKSAFAAGLGIGIAVAAAGAYAWKKFKETHPDFNLKDYCEKCGIVSDECDWSCDEDCENCTGVEPQYEECDIEDVEIDMTDDEFSEDEESDEEDEDHSINLTGANLKISLQEAQEKVLTIAKKIYGESVSLETEGDSSNMLLTNDGKTRSCYMFWIASEADDVTPVAVFYVDIMTGEVFDNSEKGMKKLSD